MQERNTFEQKTIVADTAEEFDRKVNAILAEANNPEIIYRHDCFCAIVKIPKVVEHRSIAEVYEEMGEGHLCGECRFFVKAADKRIKYTRCTHCNSSVYYGKRACNFFYELLEGGEGVLSND